MIASHRLNLHVRRALLGLCLTIFVAAALPARAEDPAKSSGNDPGTLRPLQATGVDEQKTRLSMAQGKQFGLALKLFATDNDGTYPASLDALSPDYITAEHMKKLLVSPFAPGEPVGYKYNPGLTDAADPKAILLEDKFAPRAIGLRIVIHLDDSAEAIK